MARISNIVRSFVVTRLLDTSTGFLHWLPTIAATDSNYNGTSAFTLQTTAPRTLFVGAFGPAVLAPGDYEPSGSYCCVYSLRDQSVVQGMVTPSEFSGIVQVNVDFYLSFASDRAPADAESLPDMVEDAMYETFNSPTNGGLVPSGMLYNNEMSLNRGPLLFGGQNWQQLNRYTLTYRLYTMGR